MKYLCLLLVFAALALTDDDGCGEIEVSVNPQIGGTDAITLTLLNDWILTEKALGLDVISNGAIYYVLGADNNLDILQAYDPDTGTPSGSLVLDAGNGSCFGVAWNNEFPPNDAYLTNDWNATTLFYTEDFGSTWITHPNPAGTLGRGMDFDGVDYWQTDRDGGSVWRFQPGTGAQEIAVPEVSGGLSGLTVYPEGSDLGVIVAGYNDSMLYFYVWNGTTMNYVGSASCPVASLKSSFGLAYHDFDGTLYWSYKDLSDNYHLAKLQFDTTSLQHSTWGSIKSTF